MTQSPKRHLDRFTRFAQLTRVPNTQTHRHTHKHTTLRMTSVAIGRIFGIYAMHAMWPNNK